MRARTRVCVKESGERERERERERGEKQRTKNRAQKILFLDFPVAEATAKPR